MDSLGLGARVNQVRSQVSAQLQESLNIGRSALSSNVQPVSFASMGFNPAPRMSSPFERGIGIFGDAGHRSSSSRSGVFDPACGASRSSTAEGCIAALPLDMRARRLYSLMEDMTERLKSGTAPIDTGWVQKFVQRHRVYTEVSSCLGEDTDHAATAELLHYVLKHPLVQEALDGGIGCDGPLSERDAADVISAGDPVEVDDGGGESNQPPSPLLSWIYVASYGVLGTKTFRSTGSMPVIEQRAAAPPDMWTVAVDPVSLDCLQEFGPQNARGVAGELYRWLGIAQHDAFPASVRSAVRRSLDAKFHSYGDKKVIHVAAPDLHDPPYRTLMGNFGRAENLGRIEAVRDLSTAYRNIFRQFARSGLMRLRLLPIGTGVCSGEFEPDLPSMTAEAIGRGFARLAQTERAFVLQASIELCVPTEDLQASYSQAIKVAACLLDEDTLVHNSSPRENNVSESSQGTSLRSAMIEAVTSEMPVSEKLQSSNFGTHATTQEALSQTHTGTLSSEFEVPISDVEPATKPLIGEEVERGDGEPLPDFDELANSATVVAPIVEGGHSASSSRENVHSDGIRIIEAQNMVKEVPTPMPLNEEVSRTTCRSDEDESAFASVVSVPPTDGLSSPASAKQELRVVDAKCADAEASKNGSSELESKLAAQRKRSDGEQLAALLAAPKDRECSAVTDQLAAKLAVRRDRIESGEQVVVACKVDASSPSGAGPMHEKLAARRAHVESACGETTRKL